MAPFPSPDFLLRGETALRLYETFARDLPIVDYHCHLDPKAVAGNVVFEDIVDLWIATDPYKWRAMRLNGIPEEVITGDAPPEQKFAAWAKTLPRLAGNPLYHWSAMELQRYFGISEPLGPENAEKIRETCNEQLAAGEFRARDLLERARVESLCTSDDWTDSLEHHFDYAGSRDPSAPVMLPSLRADLAWTVDSPGYRGWLSSVSEATGMEVADLAGLKSFLTRMLDRFHEAGCRIADHGLPDTRFTSISDFQAESLFCVASTRGTLTESEAVALRSSLQAFLVAEYARRGWTLLLHAGAQRQTSSRLRRLSGPAGGFACIGSSLDMAPLCRFFDLLEEREALPRTILFPLNPSDYEMFASVTGSFSEDCVWGKVQLGPAWWHNDHCEGIRRQLKATAAYSLLGRFIGMTTDSRSFLSTVRHDYFRRVFCDLVGGWVEAGSLPDDDSLLRPLVQDVCYQNARNILKENLE